MSIRSVFEANPSYGDGLISEMAKAQSDKAYRKKVIYNLKKSKGLSAEDVVILSRYGDSESIQFWIDEGGNVASEDDFEKDHSMLELVCFSYEKSPEVDERIKAFADQLNNAEPVVLGDVENLPLEEPPLISDISIAADAILTDQITLTFGVNDVYGATNISVAMAGETFTVDMPDTPSVTIDTTLFDDGPQSIVITAENIIGVTTVATIPVIVANDGIVFSHVLPADNTLISGEYTFSADVHHAAGIKRVYFIWMADFMPPAYRQMVVPIAHSLIQRR